MATVRFNRKTYTNIFSIKLKNSNNISEKLLILNNNKMIKMPIKPIKIELKGDVNQLSIDNVAFINGDIINAEVNNSLYTDGIIKQFNNCRNSIQYDRNLDFKSKLLDDSPYSKSVRCQIIHIEGNLVELITDISNVYLKPIIIGNVKNVLCGNCLYTKGNVHNCQVGNMIYSNMSIKQSRKEKQAKKNIDDQLEKDLENIFKYILN